MEATVTLDGSIIVNLLLAVLAAGVTILTLYRLMSRDMKERFDLMSKDTKERFDLMSKDTKERFDLMSKDTKERFDKIDGRLDKLSGRIEEVNSTLSGRIEEVNSTLSGRIDQLADRLDGRIDGLSEKILMVSMNKSPSLPVAGDEDGITGAQSPLTLMPRGQRIADAINAKAIAEKYADEVFLTEEAAELDIQMACFVFAHSTLMLHVNQEEKELIKKAIYEEGGDASAIYSIFGILLRDCLLEKRGFEVPVRKPEGGQTPPQQQPSNHPHA